MPTPTPCKHCEEHLELHCLIQRGDKQVYKCLFAASVYEPMTENEMNRRAVARFYNLPMREK